MERRTNARLSYDGQMVVQNWFVEGLIDGQWAILPDGGPLGSQAEAEEVLELMAAKVSKKKSEPKKKQTRAELEAEIERLREENEALKASPNVRHAAQRVAKHVYKKNGTLMLRPEGDD